MTSRPPFLLALGTLLLLPGTGCRKPKPPEEDLPKANIETLVVHPQTVADQLTLPAHVEPDPTHLVHVYPPLSGRILSLSVVPGQEVRRGQTIAVLQSGDVASARADFQKARTEADRADRARDRGKLLLDHEVLSQASFQDLEAAAASAHAELDRARQRIHELGFTETGAADTAPIASPLTGTVLDLGTATGEMQRSLETSAAIATIANLDTVWVVGEVFERDLDLLKRSAQVEVTTQAYPGEVFHGALANIGDVFDPATHSLRVRVVLPNPGHRLKPAMFANLLIARPALTTVVVPADAVLHEGADTFVYVQGPDGKYVTRAVRTGNSRGSHIEISSGLRDGDRIVKSGAAFLRQPVGD